MACLTFLPFCCTRIAAILYTDLRANFALATDSIVTLDPQQFIFQQVEHFRV